MKGFLLLCVVGVLSLTLCTGQLVTMEMMCEMECLKQTAGGRSVKWDSPEATACRKQCMENPMKYLPDITEQGQ